MQLVEGAIVQLTTKMEDLLTNIGQELVVIHNDTTFIANTTQSIKSSTSAVYRDWETDRKSTRLNSSHSAKSRMPSSA